MTISSFDTPISPAISDIVGSFCFFFNSCSFVYMALYAISLRLLLTLIALLSRRYLFISPIIIGTAYVENCTPCPKSKLSIAFINPIHPIWNKSSIFSLLLENLPTMLNTSRRLPFMNSSLASVSPSLTFTRSSLLSLALSSGKSLVFTPHMVTLTPAIIIPPKDFANIYP